MFYEAVVGINYINPMIRFFPCFMKTYGAFHSDSYSTHEDDDMDNGITTNKTILKLLKDENTQMLTMDLKGMEKNCEAHQKTMLLIQYLQNPVCFGSCSIDSFSNLFCVVYTT
jgi:hypothetical protein